MSTPHLQPDSDSTSSSDHNPGPGGVDGSNEVDQRLPVPRRHQTPSAQRYRSRRSSSGIGSAAGVTSDAQQSDPDASRQDDPALFSNYGLSSEARRHNLMMMDRKRRLTGSTQENGRQRQGPGTLHERPDILARPFDDAAASSRVTPHPHRRSSSNTNAPHEVVDLTQSPPARRHELPLPPPPPPPPPPTSSQTSSLSPSRLYVVPRWQPDAEATQCPICRRPFSLLFRRHHCRKCGRVVCNDCSPHRITIPRQYIVSPPGVDAATQHGGQVIDLSGNDDDDDDDDRDLDGDDDPDELGRRSSAYRRRALARQQLRGLTLGGGEKVRLCNPCVPDPQPAHQSSYLSRPLPPPPTPARRTDLGYVTMPRGGQVTRMRPQPATEPFPGMSVPHYLPPIPHPSQSRLQRSHASTFNSFRVPPPSGHFGPSSSYDVERHSGRGTAPTEPSFAMHGRHQSLDHGAGPLHAAMHTRVHSVADRPVHFPSMHAGHPALPPRRPLSEDDICPICRRLLPPRRIDGDESAREAHIVDCIHARDPSATGSQGRAPGSTSSPPRGPMHMLTFVATEKDCVGEDGGSLECSICMVEYDVGEQLARLECLCKFHRDCIVSWFERKQECPVHKIT